MLELQQSGILQNRRQRDSLPFSILAKAFQTLAELVLVIRGESVGTSTVLPLLPTMLSKPADGLPLREGLGALTRLASLISVKQEAQSDYQSHTSFLQDQAFLKEVCGTNQQEMDRAEDCVPELLDGCKKPA